MRKKPGHPMAPAYGLRRAQSIQKPLPNRRGQRIEGPAVPKGLRSLLYRDGFILQNGRSGRIEVLSLGLMCLRVLPHKCGAPRPDSDRSVGFILAERVFRDFGSKMTVCAEKHTPQNQLNSLG